ncbi:hypothetical protein ACN4EK_01385 [Pantanalinema rosaneae CENA516]|uniref:hypothetical protein n=1 Tax=Pantanalinema rosaneae TaxID=1620701 RepID=UPI003D6E8C75
MAINWGGWSPWAQMKRRQRQVHDLLQAKIDDRRSQPETGCTDILSLIHRRLRCLVAVDLKIGRLKKRLSSTV